MMKLMSRMYTFVLTAMILLAATPLLADRILVFKAPNTWAGQQGGENLVYHGVVDPQDRAHYMVSSAFYDNTEGRFVIGADAADAGDWSDPGGFHYSDLTVGRSVDGLTFTDWRTALWAEPSLDNIRLYNLSILPDPARPGVWFGLFGFNQQTGPRRTARIEIDNNLNVVRVSNGSSTWKTYPLGSRLDIIPHAITTGRPTSFARVEVDGQSWYEFWTFAYTARSGQNPCPGGVATLAYTNNTSADTQGRKMVRWVYNPMTFALSGPYDVGSSVRPMPTDYDSASLSLVTRTDLGTREAVYSGTTDQRICEYNDTWNPWHGSSVRFTRILKQPDGSFSEGAGTWLLNIKNPNWTCRPGITTCYASTMRPYAFVGAYPVIRGSEIFFYVEVWGGFVPQ